MWLSLISKVFNWKVVAVLVTAALIGSASLYTLSLNGELRELENDLRASRIELQTIHQKHKLEIAGYQAEMQAYDDSLETFRFSLKQAQEESRKLDAQLTLAGEQDATLQECLQKRIPSSVLDSLY